MRFPSTSQNQKSLTCMDGLVRKKCTFVHELLSACTAYFIHDWPICPQRLSLERLRHVTVNANVSNTDMKLYELMTQNTKNMNCFVH